MRALALTRRQAISIAAGSLAATLAVNLSGCRRGTKGRIVLYSSIDDALLKPMLAAFESESNLAVDWVGDTEATKTTGLVERILAERARPRADVWWSSEPLGTMRLLREGALTAPTLGPTRARLIVGRPNTTPIADLRQLTSFPSGRVGMARPEFGTTRAHLAIALDELGEAEFDAWCRAMRKVVRLYDGNAAVVRGLAAGEIDVGLTDSDDVEAGRAQGWNVAAIAEPGTADSHAEAPWFAATRPVLPTSAGLIAGGPNNGRALLEWIASPNARAMMTATGTGFTQTPAGDVERWMRIAGRVEPALAIWNRTT